MKRRATLQRPVRRAGNSMLELVAASTLIGITLVPALRIMSTGLQTTRKLTTAEAVATLGASMLERTLAQTSATWATTGSTGNFSAEGYASIGYSIVRSENSSDGGIPNSLMAVTVTTWDDRDGNGRLDAGEPSVVFASKLAKLTSYGFEARNS